MAGPTLATDAARAALLAPPAAALSDDALFICICTCIAAPKLESLLGHVVVKHTMMVRAHVLEFALDPVWDRIHHPRPATRSHTRLKIVCEM